MNFLLVNKILNISLIRKIIKKIKTLCIFHPQVITYKRNFDKNRRFYFLIKEQKVFLKYMEILERVRNIIKHKFNIELMYSKKPKSLKK